MTTPLFPASPDHDRPGANAPTEDFSVNAADDASATANLSDDPTVPYPKSGFPPREHDATPSFFAPNTDMPTTAAATPRLRPRFGTIFWGILLLAFATYMVVFTLLPAPPDPTLWLLGGVIAVGLGLVVAGIAAAARRAD